MSYAHRIRVTLGEFSETGAGLESEEIEEFEVVSDMLELADPFTLLAPCTRELWDLARPDSAVRIFVDETQILDGYVDERERELTREGSSLTIAGRDKGGRLVDESAPFLRFDGLTLEDLARKLAAPWFPTVTVSNARNRALVRGRGRRLARTGEEPAIDDRVEVRGPRGGIRQQGAVRKVEPGQSIADVLGHFLGRAELLAWSSADGRELVIGRPNYEQAPQWHFFAAAPGSGRRWESNVEAVTYAESVSERYSEITVVGTGQGDDDNYGPNVTRHTATAKSDAFLRRKRLTVVDDDVETAAAAAARAAREMALRDASGRRLELEVGAFGQALGGEDSAPPALFACDTMARFEDEELGVRGDYLVTRVVFRRNKRDGERATLTLVPKGTDLTSQ